MGRERTDHSGVRDLRGWGRMCGDGRPSGSGYEGGRLGLSTVGATPIAN